MARGQMHPRERRLALIAGLVIGCWVVVSFVAAPLWDRVKDLDQRVIVQSSKLEKLSRLLSQQPKIEREYEALSMYLSPEEEETAQAGFLGELEALARKSQVQINLKPRPPKREGKLSELGVEVDIETSQSKLFSFLDALFSMQKLIEVERVRIFSVPTKEALLRAHLLVERVALVE